VFITSGGSAQGVTGAVEIVSADAAASGSASRRHLLAGTLAVSGNARLGSGRLCMNNAHLIDHHPLQGSISPHRPPCADPNPPLLSQMSSYDVVSVFFLILGSGNAVGSSGGLRLFTGDSDAAASGSVLVATGDSLGGPGGNIDITVGRGMDVTSGNVSLVGRCRLTL